MKAKPVLFIDDDLIEHKKLERTFQKLGYSNRLFFANDGKEGLDFLEECSELPGLILLDLNMPRMGGNEFLKVVKASERYKAIPIVVITSSSSEKDLKDSLENFASGYVVKPIMLSEYEEQIQTIHKYWEPVIC